MKIDIARLKRTCGAVAEVKMEGQLPVVGEDVTLLSPVTADLRLTSTGAGIMVEGKLQVKVRLRCSRCLEEFTRVLEIPLRELYREEGQATFPATKEEQAHEEGVTTFTGETIDLTEMVRDTLLTALPMKALCREDCRGLCPRCGKNLNQGECSCPKREPDPRLAVLSMLLETQGKKKH